VKAECCGAYPGYICDGCPKAAGEPAKPETPAARDVATATGERSGNLILLWAPDLPLGGMAVVQRISGHEFSWKIQSQGAKK
jgi:hypothetical protein